MNKTEKLALVKHVAMYLRISDEKKTKGKRLSEEETFENHKKRLTDYCSRMGYTFEIFQEIVSGGKMDIGERPELQKLLARLTDFDAILVNEITRLSRDTFIASMIQQKMVTFDKLIITPEHSYYLKDSNDALMYGINNVISAHEREVIGKRIKFNKLEMARRGLNASGSAPIGYIRNPDTKKLEIDKKLSHIPATAFYLNSLGFGSAKISEMFLDMGFKTAKGRLFTNQSMKDLLACQTYKGFTVYHDYEKRTILVDGAEVVKREIKDTIIIPDTHPAIISPGMFDKLAQQRKNRILRKKDDGSRERGNKTTAPSIVKDLVYCSVCGRKKRIAHEAAKDRWFIRGCHTHNKLADGSRCTDSGMIAGMLEEKVMAEIFEYKQQLETEIEMLLNDDTETIDADHAKIKSHLEKQLKDLKSEAEKLGEKYVDAMLLDNATITAAFEKKINDNTAAQHNITIQLDGIKAKIAAPKAEEEIQQRMNMVDIIKKIENETDAAKINNFLKQFIFKIHTERHVPEGTNPKHREHILPTIKIEFI